MTLQSKRDEPIGSIILNLFTSDIISSVRDVYKLALKQDIFLHIYGYHGREPHSAVNYIWDADTMQRYGGELMPKFIKSLCYSGMAKREEQIVDPEERTFEWVLDRNQRGSHRSLSFRKWLYSGDGVFWISGNPGSGKSTLMKYLHGKVTSALNNGHDNRIINRPEAYWRNFGANYRRILANFYFWSCGFRLQRTVDGLLRSLLAQILREVPELIPAISPSRCEAILLFGEDPKPFSIIELRQMFLALIHNIEAHAIMYLFIDGLDEAGDGLNEVLDLLQEIRLFSNIKLCVASRQTSEIEFAFGNDPGLQLHDLIRDDIYIYVERKLGPAVRSSIDGADISDATRIVDMVVEKSFGVFLWVNLAVREVMERCQIQDATYISTCALSRQRLAGDY